MLMAGLKLTSRMSMQNINYHLDELKKEKMEERETAIFDLLYIVCMEQCSNAAMMRGF